MMNDRPIERPIGFKPSEISALINEDVVQQHAEEAAFQWLLRDAAALAPNYNLKDLEALDETVEANLDGLRVAGGYGWRVCEAQMAYEEPGEVFAAGVLAFEGGDEERIQKVLDVAGSDQLLSRSLISSLGWINFEAIEAKILKLLASDVPAYRYIGIGGHAVHRRDPGEALIKAVNDSSDIVRARALKAVGELGRNDLIPAIMTQRNDNDAKCRFYAAWSAARLGDCSPEIIAALGDFVILASDFAEQALTLVLRCMQHDQADKLYRKLKASPGHARLAAVAPGIIGDPVLIPELITMMHQADISRVAGESFSMITGIDIEYDDLDQDPPQDFQAGPTEAADDDEVDMDQDEDLPWPNPNLIEAWWQQNQGRYEKGQRYLGGLRVDAVSLQTSLQNGNQRLRRAAALELAVRNPDQPLFEIRAPGRQQMNILKI